ncbi:hypothetical protein EHS13_08290 [Paenibacillus psychroresistens]|uniref:Uncharacterized protein n=1 Tax=Paenibacillus psychroresistens TaxID=1778678 RepID=A0A6B8RH01_9BACL|nr:hypothetical protein [Paenibacillus psychroresistens]QGQ94875.1 hypothetical protein EHS13_08290 [Paenibacillus psychroresistens]
MYIKHRITFFDTEIQVNQNEQDVFFVSILSNATPLGSGNVLEEYPSEAAAIEAAERLHRTYSIAKENGYHLLGTFFTKHEKENVDATQMMKSDYSDEELITHFNA